ncbi:YjcZ family sporulation protein [Aquibacillus halophilus]|uniref:YjcZ family sporulation protein n=1 Tax=Aquibacillus halophilus TaxID=930132 RepID=A0A6A8DDL1_9BACI|nr:YjcZ family sporulation protein [Aquibacillus halophilus]MRH41861.1 YjcZ family sporulation protein [Aquibacillus halophilus]
MSHFGYGYPYGAVAGYETAGYGAGYCGGYTAAGAGVGYGAGNSFALIVVLFILLIIVGATFYV